MLCSLRVETNKPTFRQLVAHNVRYTNVKSEIEELEHIKKQMHLNPDFDNDMAGLSDLKYKITVLSSQLSSLKLRHDIMEEAKEEILSNKSNIDADTLKIVYNQAKKFVPTLHHTFEDLLKHHNSMLVKTVCRWCGAL